jgi:multisubunit Na+/H+ antiporter MnhB subunit
MWLIIGVSWFVIGVISYLLFLFVFRPAPVFRQPGETADEIPDEGKGWGLPPFWNSLRMSVFTVIGLVMVILLAPFLLLACICARFLKPEKPSSQ